MQGCIRLMTRIILLFSKDLLHVLPAAETVCCILIKRILTECLQIFQQYAVEENIRQTGNPFAFGKVLSFVSAWELKEVPSGLTCELISFKEVMKEKGIDI